ncbi:ROK family protein [Chitinophaga sp. MM2321]|uniref:ROK family protein n=1 Tax=Chitinophaga sp. MM2321 TaxID=3137178 RepID=UPI0032D5955D
MAVLAMDLGGTKLAVAVFSPTGILLSNEVVELDNRQGNAVGALITGMAQQAIAAQQATDMPVQAIGISVPGINHQKEGTVWAPNIPGWDAYPLLKEVKQVSGNIPVIIESDRACYVLGEQWQGNAHGCKDVIFLAVGTGIGAGILVNGKVLRGAHDIAGAIGWMALQQPFRSQYVDCGCFEYHASGEGIAKVVKALLAAEPSYNGVLRQQPVEQISARDVFAAYDKKDVLATTVIQSCITYWGMAVANLVSLFNPQKIIFGGGVFGPATALIPAIKAEALKWAQPISMQLVSVEATALNGSAGIYGAGFLALQESRPS